MSSLDIKKKIEKACTKLYQDSIDLILNKTHERTIAAEITNLLLPMFKDWNINVEYNREGNEGKSKRSPEGELLLPDIIIHTRGNAKGPNLAAIQVKGYWNPEDRTKDEEDLRKLRASYGYKKLYRLELQLNAFKLIEVN
jgi:hypothetical protein